LLADPAHRALDPESLAARRGLHRTGRGIHRRVLRYPRRAERCRRKKEGDPDRNALPLNLIPVDSIPRHNVSQLHPS